MKSIKTFRTIAQLKKQLEEDLHRAREEMNGYSSEFEKLNAKVQHSHNMRELLLNAVEAMSAQPDQKGSLLLFQQRSAGGRKLQDKKSVRAGNIQFVLDQDFQGELEALRDVVEVCKKRVFLLEKAVEALSHLKPGREATLRVLADDGIPLKVYVKG